MASPRRAWPTEPLPTIFPRCPRAHVAPCPRRNTQRRAARRHLSETFAEKVTVPGAEAGMNFVVRPSWAAFARHRKQAVNRGPQT